MILSKTKIKSISAEQFFMLSVMIVNGGNYLYNLLMGRILGPEQFSDAAILITFLLVLSFMAMTFQLTVTRFISDFTGNREAVFLNKMKRIALLVSITLATLIAIFSSKLQVLFQTGSSLMFLLFALGVPVYFLMSINRGYFQGHKDFFKLSFTYQGEMLSRLFITLLLLFILKDNTSVIVASGILVSLLVGMFPVKKSGFTIISNTRMESSDLKNISRFIVITAFYEFTQIIINNSDILLVKHYFNPNEAGLYASLALIGRVVYFVAWMFVMILLPTVVQMRKRGEDTKRVFLKYLGYVGALAFTIVVATAAYPELIVSLMFGDAYLSIAPLLWKYAIATSIFALANVFVYYFLSLDKYVPVILSGIFGLTQVASIIIFHSTLGQVVDVQIIIMIVLLVIQLSFFLYHNKKTVQR